MSTAAMTPLDQLLALLPKLFEGNGNLATVTALLPSGMLETILNSPYGPALVDILNSQTGNRPLEYSDRLLSIMPIPRWAWTGTGVAKVVKMAHQVVGNQLPENVVNLVMTTQYNIYGNFPTKSDIAPSAIFVAVNGILMCGHFYVFGRGYMRNHHFWPSFGLGWHCILNMLGFGMRIGWASNVLNIQLGIASTVMIVVSIVYVNAMNLLLAHRILTFRHPETGDATWFGWIMIGIYMVIIGVIVMAVISQVVIFLYFLDYNHWRQATGAMQASSVFATLVAIGGVGLIGLAYVLPRGALSLHHDDRRRLPASNIESYGMFYFPPKYSQVLQYEADPSAKIDSGKLAARVLNGRDLSSSAAIIIVTSLILTTTAAMRCATCFLGERWALNVAPIYSNTLFYIGFGLFETIANVIFLVVRIDLRFYIPDWPIKGTGPLTIKPGTMEIMNNPYRQGPPGGPDEKHFEKAHFEEVQPPLPMPPMPTYGASYGPVSYAGLSPEVLAAANAMHTTPGVIQKAEQGAEQAAEKGANPHTAFSETTKLPDDSEFVDPIPPLPEKKHSPDLREATLPHLVNVGSTPGTPNIAAATFGEIPRHGAATPMAMPTVAQTPLPTLPTITTAHEPSFAQLQRERLDATPSLPEIAFPPTPYQIRSATPAAFPTPLISPATPQQFPEAHFSRVNTPMERGFTPVTRGFTPKQDLSEPTYGVPYADRVSIPSPVHDYDPHYSKPYEEPKDEFRNSGGSDE
ncbi:hypothetical protein CJU90_5568 [Yarrowia sp. C11]|nr:hypothetical protein CJU90_5568 [Yarrowia sp. C11]KAG5364155.1 hypothetical protein CKK34_2946 [Yarrowia sp. E02]